MDSEALETFLAVHRQGGVSAAASALSRTQSAISRRLALLEREIGAPLFERIGRGLVLSELGAALLPYAERVAAAIGDAKAIVAEASAVQMATVGTLANAALTNALQRAKAAHPTLDVRLQTATSAEVSAKVRTGEVSVGLRYFSDASPDLDCRVVQQEHLVVVCAASHRFAGKRLKSLAQLAQERWLAFPLQERRGEAFAASVFAQFLTRGIDPIDWVAIDGLTAQKRLVEAGFGLALLQASAIEEELARQSLAVIRVDDLSVSIPVTRIVRRAGHQSAGAEALLKELERGLMPASNIRHTRAQPGRQ